MDYFAIIKEKVPGARDYNLQEDPLFRTECTPTGVDTFYGEHQICFDVLDATEHPTQQVDGYLGSDGNKYISLLDWNDNLVLFTFDANGSLLNKASYVFDSHGEWWYGHPYVSLYLKDMYANFSEGDFVNDDKLSVIVDADWQNVKVKYANDSFDWVELGHTEYFEIRKYYDDTCILVAVITVSSVTDRRKQEITVKTKYFDKETFEVIHSSTRLWHQGTGVTDYFCADDYKEMLAPFEFEDKACTDTLVMLKDDDDILNFYYEGVVIGKVANNPQEQKELAVYKGKSANYTAFNAIVSSGFVDQDQHIFTIFVGKNLLKYECLIHSM